MKKLAASGFALTALCLCAQPAQAFQGGSGRDMSTTTTNRGASAGGRGGKDGGKPLPRVHVPPARLSVRTSPPASTVLLDGTEFQTDASGFLRLPARKPGRYVLVVFRNGYHRYERVVELSPGENGPLDIPLTPMPSRLRVTPKPDGADIHIAGVGSYTDSADAELQPGDYLVRVTKLGYLAAEQNVKITPGHSSNLTLTLDPLPPSDLVSLAESSFHAGRFEQALTLGGMAYQHLPSHPRLNFILGLSLLRQNRQAEAFGYLRRAVELGEAVAIGVKHFHKLKKGEGLCQGQIVVRRGELEFRSGEGPADSFRVALNRVSALRPTADRGGGLSMKVYLTTLDKKKKPKEQWVDYHFHPPEAALQSKNPRKANSPHVVTCHGCGPTAQFFYDFVQQLSR
jgi:PEGA domain